MATLYQPFVNLPPLDLAKLDADLRELARMRAIEGEYPLVGTRQCAKAILDGVAEHILYVEVPPAQQPLDHVLHCIQDVCRVAALSEPEQLREFGAYHAAPSADDVVQVADRLAQVAVLDTGTPAAPQGPECHVTLLQMAGIVNRSKRTLQRFASTPTFPLPQVEGAGGRPSEWRWSDVRPILESEYGRSLPKVFPADRFAR